MNDAPDHKDRAHSTLGASSAYRWIACPGSVAAIAALPPEQRNKSSVYAKEGTTAHELGEVCLRTGKDAIEFAGRLIGGSYAPGGPRSLGGGEEVSGDMAEAVQVYLDYARSIADADQDVIMIEQRFDLSGLNPPPGCDMFGTSDLAVYKRDTRRLHVVDYKHGQGVAVEAVGNPQLRYYALGALLVLPPECIVDDVEITVVQPRAPHAAGPIRSEIVGAFDLIEWSAGLMAAAARTRDVSAPLEAGEHCRFCPAAATCPALSSRALAVAQAEFTDVGISEPPPPSSLTPDKIAAVLEAAPMIEKWLDAVRSMAFQTLEAGGKVPGYKLVQGKPGSRAWTDELDAVLALSLAGVADEDMYERKLISVAKAEKLVGKKDFGAACGQAVKRPPGRLSMAPESDSRPAVQTIETEFETF